MSTKLINRGQARGVDTSYRAEASLPHPTDCIMLVLRHFCVSLCARCWGLVEQNLGVLGIWQRAIGALRGVQS
jgi:hypothetical protein